MPRHITCLTFYTSIITLILFGEEFKLKQFIVQLMHTNYKILRLLK